VTDGSCEHPALMAWRQIIDESRTKKIILAGVGEYSGWMQVPRLFRVMSRIVGR
jgi:hypothetical protein